MKAAAATAATAVALALCAAGGARAEPLLHGKGKKVTLAMQEEDARKVFDAFAEVSGLTIVVDVAAAAKKLGVAGKDAPWDVLLDDVLQKNALVAHVDGPLVVVARAEDDAFWAARDARKVAFQGTRIRAVFADVALVDALRLLAASGAKITVDADALAAKAPRVTAAFKNVRVDQIADLLSGIAHLAADVDKEGVVHIGGTNAALLAAGANDVVTDCAKRQVAASSPPAALALVGTASGTATPHALLADPGGGVFVVSRGACVGSGKARVKTIIRDAVTLDDKTELRLTR